MRTPRRIRIPAGLLAATLLLGTACSDPTAPENGPEPVAMAEFLSTAIGPGISGTVPCPAGGEVTRELESRGTVTGDVAVFELAGALGFRGCGHMLNGKRVTIDGDSDIQATNTVRLGGSGPAELILSITRQSGTHRWRGEDFDYSCTFDFQTRTIPAQGIREVTGTMCGRRVGR